MLLVSLPHSLTEDTDRRDLYDCYANDIENRSPGKSLGDERWLKIFLSRRAISLVLCICRYHLSLMVAVFPDIFFILLCIVLFI